MNSTPTLCNTLANDNSLIDPDRNSIGQVCSQFLPGFTRLTILSVILLMCIAVSSGFLFHEIYMGRRDPGVIAFCLAQISILLPVFWYCCVRGFCRSVDLHEHGLVMHDFQNSRVVRFDEIREIYHKSERVSVHGIPVTTKHFYSLTFHEPCRGKRVDFTPALDRVEELGKAIENKVVPRLLSNAIAELAEDNSVWFGEIGIRKDGLFTGKSLIAWNDLSDLRAENGSLYLDSRSQQRCMGCVRLHEIPNLSVCLLLISELCG